MQLSCLCTVTNYCSYYFLCFYAVTAYH